MGVFKKGNRWYTDLYDSNGNRRRQVVKIEGEEPSTISRKEAEKVEAIRKAQLAQGVKLVNSRNDISFKELVRIYLEWADENHKSPERDHISCSHLLKFFKDYKASKISIWLVDKYKFYRKAQNKKHETINKELGALRRMFNLAKEWNKILDNPLKGMKLLKVQNRQPRVLKNSEFINIYNVASEHFKPILLCAYFTGMRRGEIRNLKWSNVDLEDGYITIVETKNNEDRKIPINKSLLGVLKRLKEDNNSKYVFLKPSGEPYSNRSTWKKAWDTCLKKSGVAHCRFHDLRHTFVSNLIVIEKEDYATVMALTGHKDISMLQRYSHTQEEAKITAIKKLGKHLNLESLDTYMDTSTDLNDLDNNNVLSITS